MDYILIYNIPIHLIRSKHLRIFFDSAINNNIIECFHFKHRPCTNLCGESLNLLINFSTYKTSFSIIKIKSEYFSKFKRFYHNKLWHNYNDPVNERCFLTKLKLCSINNCEYDKCNFAFSNCLVNLDHLNETNLLTLPELTPPSIMPKGNVGTPTNYFLKEIQRCNLPPSVIKRLGLVFPKMRRQRQYGEVKWQYKHGINVKCTNHDQNDNIFGYSFNNKIYQNYRSLKNDFLQEHNNKNSVIDNISTIDEDLEEWDRHEALYDDPSNQDRNKERLFEESLEVVWEKGGSGIVWHTDATFWNDQEDDEEKDVDEWEVDFSEYIEEGSGDKDAQDMADINKIHGERKAFKNINHLKALQINIYEEIYKNDKEYFDNMSNFKKCKYKDNNKIVFPIGEFEKYSKGVGRKILSKYGWVEGKGLGCKNAGMVHALENEGKKPGDCKGLGYIGEKLPGMIKLNYKKH